MKGTSLLQSTDNQEAIIKLAGAQKKFRLLLYITKCILLLDFFNVFLARIFVSNVCWVIHTDTYMAHIFPTVTLLAPEDWFSLKASIQALRAISELFMFPASFNRSPELPVLPVLSLPARSTKDN